MQSIQSRLVEENRALSVERSHLSDLMSNVQKMHNDLERSGENDRKRLENQIQMLEGQTYVSSLTSGSSSQLTCSLSACVAWTFVTSSVSKGTLSRGSPCRGSSRPRNSNRAWTNRSVAI